MMQNALVLEAEAELTLETRDEEQSQQVIRALLSEDVTAERLR